LKERKKERKEEGRMGTEGHKKGKGKRERERKKKKE
jgi:hypothetical protein